MYTKMLISLDQSLGYLWCKFLNIPLKGKFMKKVMILSALLMASVPGFAMDLSCVVYNRVATEDSVYSFEMNNIENNETLESDLPDQSTLSPFEIVKNAATASFSNECDNMYEVVFPAHAFKTLLSRHKTSISGKIEYGFMGTEVQHARIQCKIK